MSANSFRLFAALGLTLLLFAGGVKAAPPRTDLQGDPLPEGAVARLGVDRMCQQGVQSLLFSPDGNTLAAVGEGGVRLWDVPTGKEVRRFDARPTLWPTPATPAAFSADGKLFALLCDNGVLQVWDPASGRVVTTFKGVSPSLSLLAFDPNGRYLAAAGGYIQLWDLKAGTALDPWPHGRWVSSLAFSAGGATLTAVASDDKDKREDKAICQYAVPEGKPVGRQSAALGDDEHGALSLGGGLFAAPVSDGKKLRMLDATNGKPLWTAETSSGLGGLPTEGGQVGFSGDGRFVTATSGDGRVSVWASASGRVKQQVQAVAAGLVTCVALSRDGALLALTADSDDAIHLWDFRAGGKPREMHVYPGHRAGPLSVAFSKDGKRVFTVSRQGRRTHPARSSSELSMREWEPTTGRELRTTHKPQTEQVCCTSFSGDGRLLAVLLQDGTCHLWDAAAGKELRWWKGPLREACRLGYADGRALVYYDPAVESPCFSPDGKVLFAAGGRVIRRWSVETGAVLAALKSPVGMEESLCLPNPDGRTLLVTEWGYDTKNKDNCRMTLVDATSGNAIRSLWEGLDVPAGWSLSPDGGTLAVSEDGAVTLWEAASGRGRGRLASDLADPCGLAFSPDGRFLAVGGAGEVGLWDLASACEIRRLKGFGSRIDSLAFSPDGSLLAVAGWSNTVLIYDVAAAAGLPELSKPTEAEMEDLWKSLSGMDDSRAFQAMVRLAAASEQSAPWLIKRLGGTRDLDGQRIPAWIADLDDDDFETREKASEELQRLGVKARAALENALKAKPSVEVRSRAAKLLERLDPAEGPPPAAELLGLRVLEVLRNGRTSEARKAVAALGEGPPEARVTQEAKAVLEHWLDASRSGRPSPFAEKPPGSTLVIGR